jgi:hypothetical protein
LFKLRSLYAPDLLIGILEAPGKALVTAVTLKPALASASASLITLGLLEGGK